MIEITNTGRVKVYLNDGMGHFLVVEPGETIRCDRQDITAKVMEEGETPTSPRERNR